MKIGTMLQPSSLCYAVPSLKRIHFYEARQSAYEAFCGIAAKYEAPLMRYEAKPFQASCFFAKKCFHGIAIISFRLSRIFGKKCFYGIAIISFRLSRIFGKKWRRAFLSSPAILKRILRRKAQNVQPRNKRKMTKTAKIFHSRLAN